MKIQIDAASSCDVTLGYGKALKKAGFELEVEKGKCHRRTFITNFDFSRVPDLMSAVDEEVIISKPRLEDDVICITIYDDYLE
ncbi:hypothetical protein MUDAN_DOGOELCO_03378 [Lactiplantibacillus mudanjiangensis]|uniref:hypothetical protein n=1 Tax=Lactiplantibacillus mudanjiangensis TaxID=1296538 RepID=UPI0010149B0E|nr:hypothetical protein [Lactiplantibacillus mudanjiangensis]VDG31533.1 hypothetical protein MUDAN_DOGOELCO_03378 [Lactiplantibacillus mudanjiangensis]